MTASIITLDNDRQRLQLAPNMGGSVTAWEWKNDNGTIPLFRPWSGASEDRYTTACFPLIPWSNRITGGGFEHEGRFYPIHANRMQEHYPIHGDGWLQSWAVADQQPDRIKLTLDSKHFDDDPYHYRGSQTFTLLNDGLQIDLTVTHLGDGTLPYGLGLHPYFPSNAQTRFMARAEGVFLSGDDPIPTGHSNTLPETWNYNQPAALDGPLIDNCFTGWNGKAVISYPDRGYQLSMVMPDCNGYSLMYRPPGGDCFCFEPITHPIDAFHMPNRPGLAILGHGDSLALRAKFLIAPIG
ncbi:aldose 1-epimerase [Noviherbaspirillum galbum]|uniref:Aldose 1-epimerase n=1 Tax=Noviherbaspirillum galbum TaxID=2709383 RepID=A0A6B3SFR3_9BURK|nr:aldose 1-epimerase [Noviherbaspirillum galbum]NEX59737.1 aldose 1-epimerase [Noviherbaspirillum galbum]